MCVVGVHHPRLEPTIEDLVTLASQIGFEFALVHDKPSCQQVRTKWPETPAAFGCFLDTEMTAAIRRVAG